MRRSRPKYRQSAHRSYPGDGSAWAMWGNIVLRDRQHLAEDGIMIVVLTLEKRSSRLLAGAGYCLTGICVREGIRRFDG